LSCNIFQSTNICCMKAIFMDEKRFISKAENRRLPTTEVCS